MSRVPLPAQALVVCAAFAGVGVAAVGDYGVSWDYYTQKHIAAMNLEHILGDDDALSAISGAQNRYYGVTFELPLLLAERALGFDAGRTALFHFSATHLFYLCGGFACFLLARRLFGSGPLALVAMLLFLLHPRTYAQSFYNSKDVPFLSMFMITLWLTHRAFHVNTGKAFLLCGVSVGVLVNLRIMGMMMFPLILAMRGLDFVFAWRGFGTKRGDAKHVLVTGGLFAAAALGALYAVSPGLWADPFEFGTAVRTMAQHPTGVSEFFQGARVISFNLPPHFIPTWITISSPPMTLLFGVIGVAAVCVRCAARSRQVLSSPDMRFEALLLACLTLPLLAVALVGSHLYDAWRQMFFLHAPLCLLAALGLHLTGALTKRAVGVNAALAVAGMGLMVTAVEMVRLHPLQQSYFNFLVDRTTPEALRAEYEMDPRHDACREGLEALLRRHPGRTLRVRDTWPARKGLLTLPQTDRARLRLVEESGGEKADFHVLCGKMLHSVAGPATAYDPVHARSVYNSTIFMVVALHQARVVPAAR